MPGAFVQAAMVFEFRVEIFFFIHFYQFYHLLFDYPFGLAFSSGCLAFHYA